MFTHVIESMAQEGLGKFRYMGDLIVTGALYGAFTMELEITKVTTPIDYVKRNPGEYFLRSLVTGGGLGLFGGSLL